MEAIDILYKIYLDNCCYNRPFDDQSQIRIQLETLAKLHIQQQIKNGAYFLVWSYILDYENQQNPFIDKRLAIMPWRYIAHQIVDKENESILTFAEQLAPMGIKTFDALHIACAVYAKCDFYITTDRKLLNKTIGEIQIINPIDFIMKTEGTLI